MIPIPKEQQEMLAKGQNFGLIFSRMTSWNDTRDQLTKDNQAMNQMVRYAQTALNAATQKLLEKRHSMQKDYLSFAKSHGDCTLELEAELISPFVTGLGSGHVTETGFVLDRNLGVPYIRASSIKGVIRLAASIIEANGQDKISDLNPVLKRFFGYAPSKNEEIDQFGVDDDTKSSRGQIVFLDAYPKSCTDIIALDIMNPHFPGYYENNEKRAWPAEDQDPTPIVFLTVKPGTTFVFRCFWEPMPDKCKDEEEKVREYFRKGLEELGLGGKTSIGYGRFRLSHGHSEKSQEQSTSESQHPELSNRVSPAKQYLQEAKEEKNRETQEQQQLQLQKQQADEAKRIEAERRQQQDYDQILKTIANARTVPDLQKVCTRFLQKPNEFRNTEVPLLLKKKIDELGGPTKPIKQVYAKLEEVLKKEDQSRAH